MGLTQEQKHLQFSRLPPSLLSQPRGKQPDLAQQEGRRNLLPRQAASQITPRLSEGSAGVRGIVSLEINFPVDFLISLN